MADLTPAKQGDRFSSMAEKRHPGIPPVVQPKAEGANGRWIDIDDGFVAANNMDAWSHASEKPNHRWAWYSLDTGNLEVP